ncbi:MAG: bifunctional alpha,alpha-trehalose-phosphate synthase (UDP-forming)/trehalose-phosphatase [Chitinophagales bacterium]|nr:bifunctional alpha,alpha-trehalose-phosphate synthase (UDP-forming)/trehalose-phosphatase [Chitinophagales bacterium]
MRIIIVSNRAPVSIVKEPDGYHYQESSGGLASGLRAFMEKMKKDKSSHTEITWLGWPGATVDDPETVKKEIYRQFGTHSIFFLEELMDKFYLGFCNKTIWPLFHYFPVFTEYNKEQWEVYRTVNEMFCKELMQIYRPGDLIWIHDYHLMLLPGLIRKEIPNAAIGFFLHIPFPSYEIFRLLPSNWRKELLQGIYGADLIGFHTHDYRTHFLNSTLRILGIDDHMGEIMFENRAVKVDSFPMGIDYEKYSDAVETHSVQEEIKRLKKIFGSLKLILSIDRQDYSKGILNRLQGYELFLDQHQEWREKVVLMMVIIPSRIGVEHYQLTKSQIDELVGRINGKYGNMQWTPILYQYRSLSFDELIAAYAESDVALVTPLRDGMNLVAKEYLACRNTKAGVLILSEMAGSAEELPESIIINPNNTEEIGEAIAKALEMKKNEQHQRIGAMQKRLLHYNLFDWVNDFVSTLRKVKKKQARLKAKVLNTADRKKLVRQFEKAESCLIFLDYDGTLVPFSDHPKKAKPEKELMLLLEKLSHIGNLEVVIISGRDKETMTKWLGHFPFHLVAEHGAIFRETGSDWQWLKPVRNNWKRKIIPIMNRFTDKLPGSLIEEKDHAVVFHYRKSDPQLANLRLKELMGHLLNFTSNLDLQVQHGEKVLEVRNAGIDKGLAAMHWLSASKADSILAIGDDITDEDLFRVMPPTAFTIKVGIAPSYAKYNLANQPEVLHLLNELLRKAFPVKKLQNHQ